MSDRRLEQFSLGNSLGGGSCGTVFEVIEDESFVIKQFNSMAIDRRFLTRNFERLRVMPPVDGMARVHDAQIEKAPYLALSDRVHGGPLSSVAGIKESAAWQVIRTLADTLGHAHKHGVLHGHLH
ncbi:MAG: serine/threonine-protein kinase, partial [Verrucomicrobiota bacterium]